MLELPVTHGPYYLVQFIFILYLIILPYTSPKGPPPLTRVLPWI